LKYKDNKIKQSLVSLQIKIVEFIEDELNRVQISPEQIAGRLKKLLDISLHHEAIYRYIIRDKLSGGKL
jgi:IS30 family transposase